MNGLNPANERVEKHVDYPCLIFPLSFMLLLSCVWQISRNSVVENRKSRAVWSGIEKNECYVPSNKEARTSLAGGKEAIKC